MKKQKLRKLHLVHLNFNKDFPLRRGILKVKGHKNLCLLINDFDHIQFITSLDKSTDISPQMKDFYSFIDSIESKAEFLKDWQFGYLSTFPRLSGTGLSIKCFMKLENLQKNEKKLEDICKSYGYYFKGKSGADFNYEFGNRILIGQTEREIMENFVKFSSEVLSKDN